MSDFTLRTISEKEKYRRQWEHIRLAWKNGRLPQAMLFVGLLDNTLTDFIKKLNQMIFCKQEIKPCHECIDCRMVVHGEHPDVEWIKPEKNSGPIKIDQIRELQNSSYMTPRRAKYRLVIIESAERMNVFAANSLLKILEEPAPHTLFLLIAQQISTVLPTVLSRCQIVRFEVHYDFSAINLLQLAEHYAEDSEQSMVVKQAETILDGLIAVIEKKEHPCVVAAQWGQFNLSAILWFLYLVYAQVQMMQINVSINTGSATHQLNHLAFLLDPRRIFIQIDKINVLQRKLSHNMNVNQSLALEDLLLVFPQ